MEISCQIKIVTNYFQQKVKQKTMKSSKSITTLNFEDGSGSRGDSIKHLVLSPPPEPVSVDEDRSDFDTGGDQVTLMGGDIEEFDAGKLEIPETEITSGEFREQAEEARQRLLKALKVSHTV